MGAVSEGADGPVVRVALGLRFELFNPAGEIVGAIVREDVKGAAVPRAGEVLGRGTLGNAVHDLVGSAPVVHQIDHYLDVPASRDWAPMCMVVSQIHGIEVARLLDSQDVLETQGWSVMALDGAARAATAVD